MIISGGSQDSGGDFRRFSTPHLRAWLAKQPLGHKMSSCLSMPRPPGHAGARPGHDGVRPDENTVVSKASQYHGGILIPPCQYPRVFVDISGQNSGQDKPVVSRHRERLFHSYVTHRHGHDPGQATGTGPRMQTRTYTPTCFCWHDSGIKPVVRQNVSGLCAERASSI
jgi:hypothetical protein